MTLMRSALAALRIGSTYAAQVDRKINCPELTRAVIERVLVGLEGHFRASRTGTEHRGPLVA